MRKVILSAIAFFVLGLFHAAGAVESEDVLGRWNTEDRDAVIEIYGCYGKYCGRIVWVDEPVYSAEDRNGKEGQPKVDENNPDFRLRNRPIVGLQIMYDFSFDGEAAWKGGKIYDPERGKTYKGMMTLVSPNTLNVKGYVVIPLLGRTTTWTRAESLAR
jgi:uncharacterized protein (DUF2147 family)